MSDPIFVNSVERNLKVVMTIVMTTVIFNWHWGFHVFEPEYVEELMEIERTRSTAEREEMQLAEGVSAESERREKGKGKLVMHLLPGNPENVPLP